MNGEQKLPQAESTQQSLLGGKDVLVLIGINQQMMHFLLRSQYLPERNKDISHVYLDNTEQIGYRCRV